VADKRPISSEEVRAGRRGAKAQVNSLADPRNDLFGADAGRPEAGYSRNISTAAVISRAEGHVTATAGGIKLDVACAKAEVRRPVFVIKGGAPQHADTNRVTEQVVDGPEAEIPHAKVRRESRYCPVVMTAPMSFYCEHAGTFCKIAIVFSVSLVR
jgi:hypothetical protein